MEKSLIDGVGFSRLSENVRFPLSQVVHCELTKEMQIHRPDVLFPFFHWLAELIPCWGDCAECTQQGCSVNKGNAMSLWHMLWLPAFRSFFSIKLDAQDR